MKPLEVRLPHGLDQAEVRRRLDRGIERARTEYADKVSAIDAAWESDERLRVDLTVMGMSIAGDIDVLAAELVVRLELPTMAGLFAGRIRSGLEERLGGLLQAPARTSPGHDGGAGGGWADCGGGDHGRPSRAGFAGNLPDTEFGLSSSS